MSLLGTLIMNPMYAEDVTRYISARDFYTEKHQVIFSAIQAITKDTKAKSGVAECSVLQVYHHLQTKQTLNLCGGGDYIQCLADNGQLAETWPHFARMIRNYATVRRFCDLCDQMLHTAKAGKYATSDETEKFLSTAQRAFVKATAPLPDPNLILESGSSIVVDRLEKIKTGKINTIGTPWKEVDQLIQPFLPGSIVLLSGAPGSAKSFLALQLVSHMITTGVHADILALESGRQYHLTRRLAQVSGEASITSVDWVAKNSERAMMLHSKYADHLELIGQHVYDATDITHRGVMDWTLTRMKSGARLVCIDPITMSVGDGKIWEADRYLMAELSAAAKEYRCSILLVTHPKTQSASDRKAAPDQGDMAGGAAYARFSTSSFTLVKHKERMKYRTRDGQEEKATHYLFIGKARDGSGSGKFGMIFDQQSLTFKDGYLVKDEIGVAETDDDLSRRF
jgi:replicative DNA helicase